MQKFRSKLHNYNYTNYEISIPILYLFIIFIFHYLLLRISSALSALLSPTNIPI